MSMLTSFSPAARLYLRHTPTTARSRAMEIAGGAVSLL